MKIWSMQFQKQCLQAVRDVETHPTHFDQFTTPAILPPGSQPMVNTLLHCWPPWVPSQSCRGSLKKNVPPPLGDSQVWGHSFSAMKASPMEKRWWMSPLQAFKGFCFKFHGSSLYSMGIHMGEKGLTKLLSAHWETSRRHDRSYQKNQSFKDPWSQRFVHSFKNVCGALNYQPGNALGTGRWTSQTSLPSPSVYSNRRQTINWFCNFRCDKGYDEQ